MHLENLALLRLEARFGLSSDHSSWSPIGGPVIASKGDPLGDFASHVSIVIPPQPVILSRTLPSAVAADS